MTLRLQLRGQPELPGSPPGLCSLSRPSEEGTDIAETIGATRGACNGKRAWETKNSDIARVPRQRVGKSAARAKMSSVRDGKIKDNTVATAILASNGVM